jgi:hypothetical protein
MKRMGVLTILSLSKIICICGGVRAETNIEGEAKAEEVPGARDRRQRGH